jgi:xyloglucan-specific exo-beta-1,4-glucanase
MITKNLVLLTVCLFLGNQGIKARQFGYVEIGGGGFVTAIIGCPTEPDLFYAKTDVGGVFRWQENMQSWKPLFEWVAYNQTSYLGVESLAIDPQSPNKLYALVGTEYWDGGKTAILRSDDYGETFKITDVTSLFKANGNGSDRQKGETLAVDPNKGEILFCGTRYNNGLFKSMDSGVTWQRVNSLNVTNASISFVVFDAVSGTKGNATQTIIVGVFREGVENLYISKNGGTTWTPVGGHSTGKPHRCAISADRFLYVTYAGTAGAVKKYHLDKGTWADCTPGMVTSRGYSGIDVDKNNPAKIVATTYNWWNNQQQWGWGDAVFYSEDGGITWKEKVHRNNATMSSNGNSWIHGAIHWAGCATFNPAKPGWVFAVSGNGVFATGNIAATQPEWRFMSKGLEETVLLDLISIPGGPLISSVGDQGGFVHNDILQPPTKQISQSSGFAFAGLVPSTIARVATDLYLSNDNAATWNKIAPTPDAMTKGKVAVSADGKTIIWKSSKDNQEKCWRTRDMGKTWTACTGVNFGFYPMGDPINPSKFYAYNRNDGYLYVSNDEGSSFVKSGPAGTGGHQRIAVSHGKEGYIWIARGNSGVSYSINSGETFQNIPVHSCVAIASGKEMPGSDIPSIFIYGQPENGDVVGIYRTTDMGKTWVRADDDQHQFGHLANAGMIEADRNFYGRVYRSTAGMGIPFMDAENLVTSLEIDRLTDVLFYPNPFSNTINVKSNSPIDRIQVYNLAGSLIQTIVSGQISNQTLEFGSDLKNGMYLVKVVGISSTRKFKIIKNQSVR